MTIVFLWSAIAAFGAVVTVAILAEALRDLRAIRALGRNAARRLVARGAVRREWLRLAVQALFLLAGADPGEHRRGSHRRPAPQGAPLE